MGKQTKKQLLAEIFRFLLVGGTATVVDYIVFYLFRSLILPATLIQNAIWDNCSLVIATAFGFGVGLFVNWFLSVRFVFQDVKNKQEARSQKSFFLFSLIGIIGLVITEVGVVLLVNVLPSITLFGLTTFFNLPWSEWFAKGIMTCCVLVWNYLGRKFFIFKS